MKILQVLPALQKGGAEKMLVNLANGLIIKGQQVTVLLANKEDPKINEHLLNKKISVIHISRKRHTKFIRYIQLILWTFKNKKKILDFDVIHVHLTYGLIFGMLININCRVGNLKRPKLVATCHMVGMQGNILRFNQFASKFFEYFALVANDNQWRDFERRKKNENLRIIPNGIPKEDFFNKHKSKVSNGPVLIGTISRLESERKPWLFLEVFSYLAKQSKVEVRFRLGGDGSEVKNLRQLASDYAIQDLLTMPGLVTDSHDFLNDMDFYLSLNIEDITGVAGLEAIAAGIPVVALQLAKKYEKGESDWIWSSQSPLEVANKLISMFNNPDETTRLVQTQKSMIESKFSLEKMTTNYITIYQN